MAATAESRPPPLRNGTASRRPSSTSFSSSVDTSLARSLDSSTIGNTSSSRPLSFCTCTSKQYGSSCTSCHSTDRPFSICLFYVHHGLWHLSSRQFRSINRLVFPPRGDRKSLSSGIRLLCFAHFYSFFSLIITVNNGVVRDRRYHRCNALLMVSDSCGRRV